MFETAILDDRTTKSRTWTMAAAGMQLVVVGCIVLVPLLAPSTMQLIVKQATITFQPNPLPAAPVPQQRSASSSSASPSTFAVITEVVTRVLQAPRGQINPVVTIIDPAPFSVGQPGPSGNQFVPGTLQTVGGLDISTPPPPATPPQQIAKPVQSGPITIGGKVLEAKMIKRVMPIYPILAKQARISGSVRLEGIIAKDGKIQHLRVISGHPLLIPAALDAVRQWVYSPTQLNGQSVEVIAPIDVNFVLNN